ncbi:GDSL esterase/lipase At5g42170-like [Cynara cardunculus var. scolymus]|uniref:GDSL esterase/lipase At5g42170-like n=1 Tax=Cynara cardunculus var. scolymus TaxID=59895 RepID=UPI000D6313B5|nr:GDSL esterase/lipase At5g42170-like [Cynara cardunculus var. scolymus]
MGQARVNIPRNDSVPALIAFGDSFMDSGNNNALLTVIKANFPPYGEDFMGGKPTGRFSNGKIMPDMIAERLGLKDYVPAYLDPSVEENELPFGTSFASGGSGYDSLTSKIVNVIPLSDQLEMFKEYIAKLKRIVGEEEANNIIEKSLYLVSWSSNDWAIPYTAVPIRRLQYDVPAYSNLLVNIATNFAQEIYKLGARRIAFFGAPYFGCFPLGRTAGGGILRMCGDKLNEEAQSFNNMLKRQIEVLGSSLPQSRITYIDYYKLMQQIIENHQQYGFDVVDRGCCGTGVVETIVLCNKFSPICLDDSKFLFWDSVHLTEKGYNIVVDHALPDLV